MRKIVYIPFFILLSGLLMFVPRRSFAKIESYRDSISVPFTNGQNYTHQDPNNALSGVVIKSVQNTVALRVMDNVLISSSFTYTVSLTITYYTYAAPATAVIVNTSLTVNYVPGQGVKYKGLDIYSFSNAYKIQVTVNSFSGGVPPAGSVQLSSEVAVDRIYPFVASQGIAPAYTLLVNQKQLKLNWAAVQGAEEYDIEWTTINNGNNDFPYITANINSTSSPANVPLTDTLAKTFRNNASRITQKGTSCIISLMSTDSILLVRVRQAQYNANGVRIAGNWDYTNGSKYAIRTLKWNEQSQNWQYSAAFAEEGKKKEVISYFDGTLRGRQTVTLNNSDNVGIAQENVYDYFGRPSASILPAPFKDTSSIAFLHYIPLFNVNKLDSPYTYKNVIGTVVACELNPDTLYSIAGAAKYYSGRNDFKALNPNNKYIPDAGGYPLSVTQYTADNTGRIKSQGGVGLAFQPGKSGGPLLSKTTKYYYGKPEQWELDQLFGNDVGYAEHFLKNMVVDPNGQISISYLNASGKTVATALSGAHPANLDSLPSYKPITGTTKPQTIHILKPEQFIYNSTALTLTANTTYLASVTGTDTLKFNIQKLVDLYPGGAFQVCSDCYYLATVKVTDDCGNTTAAISTPIKIGYKPDSSNCTTGSFLRSLTVPILQPGEYNVAIQFAFDNTVIQTYTDSLVKKGLRNGYIETQFNYIKKRYLDSLDVSGCYSDCHTCKTLLASQANFVQSLKDKCTAMGLDSATVAGTAFNTWAVNLNDTLQKKCTALQANCTYSPCDGVQSVMLDDVSPGGQYALFDTLGTALEPEINVISAHWHTVFPIKPSTDTTYIKNEITRPDGTITSPNDAAFTVQDLITYWQPAWALNFLQYHPEYCKLKFCMNYSRYEGWDMQIQQDINKATDTIPTLGGTGPKQVYKYTNAADWLMSSDPFFMTGAPGHAFVAQMDSDLTYYSSRALAIAGTPLKGLIAFDDYVLYCQDTTGNINTTTNHMLAWSSCTPNLACRVADREWTTYRDNYFALKQKYYTILRNDSCGMTCPIGQPIVSNFPGSSCPVAAEFSVKLSNGVNTCGASYQTVIVSHTTGSLSTGLTVTLYYPSNLDNVFLPHSVVFNAGDSQETICVPVNIPPNSINVNAVYCGTVPQYGNDPTYVVHLSDGTGGNAINNCGSTIFVKRITNITLETSSGVPVPATNLVTVTLKYQIVDCNGNPFTISGNIYIAPTQSTGFFQYASPTNCGVACDWPESYIPTCVLSLTNASNITGITQCSGFVANNPQPPFNPCPAAYTVKIPRFPDATSNIAAYAAAHPSLADSTLYFTGPAIAAMKAQAADMCAGNATAWISKLQPGLNAMHGGSGATPTELSQLTAALISICSAGGDQTHPMGASTLPSGVSGPYASFGAAIKGILLGGGNYTTLLNPWLIDAPYPYAVQQQSVAKTISTTSKSLCTLLTALQTAAGGPSNLYSYLVTTYGSAMTLTATDISNLQSACLSCRFVLAQDVTLPIFLDPGATGCIPRATFAADTTALNAQFAGALPHSDPNYQTILSNYLNQQTGFSLTYDDYNTFAHNSAPSLCNTLPYTATNGDIYACVKSAVGAAVTNGLAGYDAYIAGIRQSFKASYINTCKLAQANASLVAVQQEYHYTLYYYDQADNLVRTVPPEGVTLIDTAMAGYIDKARDADTAAYSYVYNGPATASVLSTAMSQLSTTLTGSIGSVEMWLYNAGKSYYHWVEVTPDNKYLFQVGISGSILSIDVFPLTAPDTKSIKMIPSTGHYQANISSLLPLKPFTFVVFQGNTLGLGTALPQLYLNGKAVTVSAVAAPAPVSFTITGQTSSVTYPDSIQSLKHLRLYNKLLTQATITADANNQFFSASDLGYTGWYRFNVPAPGAPPTTINATTSDETAIFDFFPSHVLPTTYAYNGTNQVTLQSSPDGGTNRFWYDLLSRLVVSQNDKQLPANNYSYTKYDLLGRITEVGQKNQTTLNISGPHYLPADTLLLFAVAGTNSQITDTYYDKPIPTVAGNANGIATLPGQSYLRKRVAASTYTETQGSPVLRATYYNYDLDGNVKTLWQQIDGLYVNSTNSGLKRIDYEYDLISGKVNFVRYQDTQPDAFYYSYQYDADNRLTQAWSSPTAMGDTTAGSYMPKSARRMDAAYFYYLHGPLRRMVLGNDSAATTTTNNAGVQGIDYAYTLQGWLKGVNSTAVTATADMGLDGSDVSHKVAKDAYGYNLYYYNTDYKPIVTTNIPFSTTLQTDGLLRQLYNGNIAGSSVNIPQLTAGAYWIDRLYTYDQLNRIKTTTAYHTVTTPVHNGDYDEQFTYDGNGNILTVKRAGSGTGTLKDSVIYNYNRNSGARLLNNQLNYLNGHALASNITPDQALNNYTYDQIGNLTADVQAGITAIGWTVYGKILNINKASGNITYTYNPAGERVSKTIAGLTTWYIRDAQGNTLAVYDNKSSVVNWREQHLYGSSRLGMWTPNVNLTTGNALASYDTIGKKQYELKNHLDNVLETITDKRIQHTTNGTSIDYYLADIATAQDYYSFGSLMPGRQYNYVANNYYRYGFNGKENDNDVGKGIGNEQDYGMRIYDPRVGRFLSADPITKEYPWYTPYQFAGNRPIRSIDRDGLEDDPASVGRAVQSNREYEANLYKTDPKHAQQIIMEQNINAFLFVGGSLTGGSGKLATAFWDLVMLSGTARTVQGIINHNQTQTTEGLHLVTGAAMGEIGGAVINKIFEIAGPILEGVPLVAKIRGRLVSSNDVNAAFNKKGWYSPYKSGVTLAEINLPTEVSGLVRLSGLKNVQGEWFTTMEEIKGLSAAQLKIKFALKYEPTSVTPVSIQGNVRVGEAAGVEEFGTGGGFQIEALPGSTVSYGKTVPLKP